jgi:hypothetical protein
LSNKIICPDCGKKLPSFTNLVGHYLAIRDHVHHTFNSVDEVINYLNNVGVKGDINWFNRKSVVNE